MLELMGLKEGEVGENDSLADLGLDSLQLVEIRSKVQTAIGRPLPLEQARPSTACPDALPLMCPGPSAISDVWFDSHRDSQLLSWYWELYHHNLKLKWSNKRRSYHRVCGCVLLPEVTAYILLLG